MWPIGESKLSLGEIAKYWAREIQPPASRNELLQLLEAAWWLGQIRGDSVKSRLDFLKHMFKAMHDRDDAGVVFFVEDAPEPKMEQLSDGSIVVHYRHPISLPSKDISAWDESNCEDAFQSLAQTTSTESYPEMTPGLAFIELTFEEFTGWLLARGYAKTKFWKPLPATSQLKTAKRGGPIERAQRAIEALFPGGVPDQALLPNKTLCGQVDEWLKKSGLPKVSEDTIHRAAGRRK
jgi:hypothetical protein